MNTKPSYKPTPEQRSQVDAMAAYGVPEHAIARVLNIDPKTLRKHFREELDTAHTKANSAVAQSLYRKATGDGPQAVTAAIFWAKTRMGWREAPTVHKVEHGKPGDFSGMTDDELNAFIADGQRVISEGDSGETKARNDSASLSSRWTH